MQMDVGPLGSPPRMRGKGLVGFELDIRIRITPACAGKSLSPAPEKALPGDHPRMCGEKFNCNPGSPQHWGSPPHMRGKAKIFRRWSAEMGITPAYAGKSARILKRRTEKRNHPRVCGEKAVCSAVARQRLGSPPRMRGKAYKHFSSSNTTGITPAYAGKSCPFLRRTSPRRDHPRVCGEKIWLSSVCVHASGSPPRMRGKVPGLLLQHLTHGITPAYAGKSIHALLCVPAA